MCSDFSIKHFVTEAITYSEDQYVRGMNTCEYPKPTWPLGPLLILTHLNLPSIHATFLYYCPEKLCRNV